MAESSRFASLVDRIDRLKNNFLDLTPDTGVTPHLESRIARLEQSRVLLDNIPLHRSSEVVRRLHEAREKLESVQKEIGKSRFRTSSARRIYAELDETIDRVVQDARTLNRM